MFTAFASNSTHALYYNTDVSVPENKLYQQNIHVSLAGDKASCELGHVIWVLKYPFYYLSTKIFNKYLNFCFTSNMKAQ